MKILYIANERRGAELAAQELRGIAQNVTVTWARTLSAALHWVDGNRDAAAVIVEAEVQRQGCASFLADVRSLGLTTPVVVALPNLGTPLAVRGASPDGHGVDGQSLQADLARVVSRVLQRTGAAACATHQTEEAEQRLARAEEARHQAEQRCASELAAAAARLADEQARHKATLAREARICTALQQRDLELEAALRNADERHALEAASAGQLAKKHAEIMASLAQAVQWRDALAQKASVATAALEEARQARTADAAAAAVHLARREAELGAALAEAVSARTALEHALTEAEAAQRHTQQRAAAGLAAAEERRAALEDRLAQEATARTTLEQHLATVKTARLDADHWHATELEALGARLADVQAQHDAALTEHAAARAASEQQLADAAATLEQATQERASLEQNLAAAEAARLDADDRHAAERARLERRLADVEAQHGASLAEHAAVRAVLEQQLADTTAALEGARQERASEAAAAAERVAELVDRLGQESAMRTTLARDLAESRERSAQARRRFLELARAFRRRTREQKGRLEAQLNTERADWARTLGARAEEIRRLQLERETLQDRLATTRQELHRLHTVEERLQGSERARLASESERRRLSGEYDQVRQSLDQVRAAYNTLERVASDHVVERARLEGLVGDRDGQLSAQAARHVAAEQAAQDALTQTRERLRVALEAGSSDTARLQREIDALRQELKATRSQAQGLRSDAERVPVLQAQLEERLKENRRQFERAPFGLCHCTRDGLITRVNHSLLKLLGYRRADDLQRRGFATVFECADDLRWLIERSVSTGKTESTEATWTTRDRRRLVVRLQALATNDGSIEIVAEDITNLRALERRLRQAQRIEAVGRLASEVAETCDTLLRDVTRDGQQWLAKIPIDSVQHQGELLLREVTRAAGFLQRLAVHGNKQMSALGPVSIQRVLRDLEPVLKRIVGDDIDLVLPEISTSLDVDLDLDADRVERILVNVASYARERMPSGGRVRIDAATTVIGRRFLARYPSVRPGAHVLLTVTEVQKEVRPDSPTEPGRDDEAADRRRVTFDKPGVDLGALLGLVGSCGGHLWMEAEPAGNMTLKIHVPKHAGDDVTDSAVPAPRSDRGRQLSRWFRADSTAATAGS